MLAVAVLVTVGVRTEGWFPGPVWWSLVVFVLGEVTLEP